ncbi:PREDICTED: DNA-directed RNA polymerase I subunit RPA43 [Gavialis gangeticus]|uniref:DNA-directed RNA polymerase I subunit RPA43 n=1 Tax=Gavialis gangeticus TaxID=94835 RepID=UPI00092FCA87|nr:PREDICTED: DNA-directed RNA polymerase I subunit RPA43 [Gavialis gangeticus]
MAAAAQPPVPAPGLAVPSFAAACDLVPSRYSCLVVVPHRRHIALAPRFLHRKLTGIRDQLDAGLLRYCDSLGGVPLAYSHVKIVGALGDIHDDQGSIHLHIEADFVVFTPQKGTKLVGVINKIVPSHIGCLIHGCFNASIPKHDCVSAEQQQYLGLKIGDALEFEVSRLDSDTAGMFFIWGRLTKDSLQSKCPETVTEDTNRNETKKKHRKNGTVNCEGDSNLGEVVDDADAAVREYAEEQNPDVVNGLSHKKTKKKKKHKQENQEPVLPGSDTSDYQSDHKKEKRKKRKYCEENHELSQLTEEPKATKRKKQHID